MILSTLMILHLSLAPSQMFLAESVRLQEPRTSVISYNAGGMPITINTAVAENRVTDCWLTYSVTNKSLERIDRIELLVFIVDERGRLSSIEDSSRTETINAGVTQEGRAQIPVPIKHNGVSIVTVTKAVGPSGVWTIDLSAIKQAVADQISGRRNSSVKAAFEEHIRVASTDRARIFELVLNDFLNDNAKANRADTVRHLTSILVLRDNVDFDLPQIPNVNLSKVDKEEIQRLADNRGRVFYLIYGRLVVEGGRVIVRLSLRDERARRPGANVPYKFTYLFTCTKKDDQWTIEKSLGYAES